MTDPDKLTIPFRCPVCNGNGLVPAGFYNEPAITSIVPELCRSCKGGGIVYVEQNEKEIQDNNT